MYLPVPTLHAAVHLFVFDNYCNCYLELKKHLFAESSMPFKFGMRRACRYAVSSKCAYIVCVHLLDRPLMDSVLTFESTGRECLEDVANRIQLTDVSCIRII